MDRDKHMDEFNQYHKEKFEREHPDKVIKVNGPMPESWKRAIAEKREWTEEIRARGRIDPNTLKQKVIV